MATSKPYSCPTDKRVDRAGTLLGGARALLEASGKIMTEMSQNATPALSLPCNQDPKRVAKLGRKGSRASKVLHSLKLRDDTELQRNQNPYPLYVRAYVHNLSISLPCDVNTVGSLMDSI